MPWHIPGPAGPQGLQGNPGAPGGGGTSYVMLPAFDDVAFDEALAMFGAGGVKGSGTPTKIPLWNGAGLGDSSLTEVSTGITSTKPLRINDAVTFNPFLNLNDGTGDAYLQVVAGDFYLTPRATKKVVAQLGFVSEGQSYYRDTWQIGDAGTEKGLMSWTNTGSSTGGPAFIVRAQSTYELHIETGVVKRWYWNTSGHLSPWADASYDIGSTTIRVRRVYAAAIADGTNDLLSSSGTTVTIGIGAAWTAINFYTGGTARWQIAPTAILAVADNTYDIGATAASRPRTGFFGTSLVAPTINAVTTLQVAGVARMNSTKPVWVAPTAAVSRTAVATADVIATTNNHLGTLVADLRSIGILA